MIRIISGISGLADSEYILALLNAGVDEFFAGYLPSWWRQQFGQEVSPNRRYRSVSQFSELSKLEQVFTEIKAEKKSLFITINEHVYTAGQLSLLTRMVDEMETLGVDGYIVADPAVITLIRARYPNTSINLSGEAGAYNHETVRFFAEMGVNRIIFPRDITVEEIKSIIGRTKDLNLKYECFVMGEPCVYSGAHCYTAHGYGLQKEFCNAHGRKYVFNRKSGLARLVNRNLRVLKGTSERFQYLSNAVSQDSACIIAPLIEAGIDAFKVPGRSSQALEVVRMIQGILKGR